MYLKKQMQQTLCDLPMYCLYRCLVLNPKAPEIDTYAFCLSVAMVYSEEIDMNSEEINMNSIVHAQTGTMCENGAHPIMLACCQCWCMGYDL